MSYRRRIVVKLFWMAVLAGALVLFQRVRYDFVYEAF